MRIVFALFVLATLSACGADGEPTAPGLSVSGDARVGVTVTN